MPAAMLAEHEAGTAQADIFRSHDLVGRAVLQHAVLMNASFMGKRVFADNRLVARRVHAGNAGYQSRRRV